MSISIVAVPDAISATHYPINFTIRTADPVSRVKVEVIRINKVPSGTTTVGTLYYDIAGGLSVDTVIDVSGVLKAICDWDDFNLAATTVQTSNNYNALRRYKVKFSSYYFSGNLLVADANTTSSEYQVNLFAYKDYDSTKTLYDWITTGTTLRFLTDSPTSYWMYASDVAIFNFLQTENSVYIFANSFQSGTVRSGNVTAAVTLQDSGDTYRRGYIPIHAGMSFISGASTGESIITANTTSLVVCLMTGSSQQVSEYKTIFINQNCNSKAKRLYWLNQRGGIDSYSFINSQEIRTKYNKNAITNAGIRRLSAVDSTEQYSIISRYENEDMLEYLDGLFRSRQVWIYDSNYTTKKTFVIVTNEDYLKKSGDDLFAVTCNIELRKTESV